MVEFQVQHAYKCTACAMKIANILARADGVVKTRAVPSKDAALVFFISGTEYSYGKDLCLLVNLDVKIKGLL